MDENEIGEPLNFANIDTNGNEIKQEDEEEKRNKRMQQIELLKKAAMYLRNRLGTNDILDGELADFQDVLNGDDENADDTMEPISNDNSSVLVDSQPANADLTVDSGQFDPLSGYMDFVISVRALEVPSYFYSNFFCKYLYFSVEWRQNLHRCEFDASPTMCQNVVISKQRCTIQRTNI